MFARLKAALALADTLQTVVDRMDKLERRAKLDSMDVSDALDKLERLAGRVAKRAERDSKPAAQLQLNETPEERQLRIRRAAMKPAPEKH